MSFNFGSTSYHFPKNKSSITVVLPIVPGNEVQVGRNRILKDLEELNKIRSENAALRKEGRKEERKEGREEKREIGNKKLLKSCFGGKLSQKLRFPLKGKSSRTVAGTEWVWLFIQLFT